MHSPQDTLDSAIGRAAEITWWNRAMTKLNQVDGITNAQSFVADETVEQKGPYVEFVDAPQFHDLSAAEFLGGLGYDDAIVDAMVAELFGDNAEGSLYQHQAETIEAIETTDRDTVLAVPTASGKTEAFFLPILNHCLSTDEEGLKSIILYPMKTLGVDQLNRFITYLDRINRYRDPSDRVTIGIWDGDTPARVGTRDYEIEPGAYVRGLVDPRDQDEKLRVLSSTSVGTDDNQYSWIRVTRDAIRQGVDILLTVPEALDYMFVSDNEETRGILGEEPGAEPLEHIVFDEAHVWSGIQGAAVSLLSQRLKSYYADRDPQVTMVSATVDNPSELAASLTGSEPTEINDISFTPRGFPISNSPRFERFAPCDLGELVHGLAAAALDLDDPDEHVRAHGLENAVETLRTVGLVAPGRLEPAARAPGWAFETVTKTARKLTRSADISGTELLGSSEHRNRLTEAVVDASGSTSGWYEFVLESVPEVAAFTNWFDTETTGVIGFKSYHDLLEEARSLGVGAPAGVLETVMAFGRLAGIVTEKYHVFLKPPHQVHWCRECERVTRDSLCPDCGRSLPEIQFCRTCHEPYIEVDGLSDDNEESAFVPLSGGAGDSCPGCGSRPRLSDIGVPTSSLLSYMLSEVCRVTPSRKTLVFSDSHSAAESVGDTIIDTEYGLVAQSLYLQELAAAGGRKDNYELYQAVVKRLQAEYWDPLLQNEIDEDGKAYNFLHSLLETVRGHASLRSCEALLDSALVTADVVAARDDSLEMAIAHELYKLYIEGGASFTKNSVSFDGLTREKMLDRLERRLRVGRGRIEPFLDDLLRDLLEQGIVSVMPYDDVQRTVGASGANQEKLDSLRDYLERARTELDGCGITDEPVDSGIITRLVQQDRSDLVLLPEVNFCAECYASHPVPKSGDSLDTCLHCGTAMECYRRFTEDETGNLVAAPGYAEVDSGWEYAVDHWAHDVTREIRDGAEPQFVTVGIHKGNIPHAVRGAIEESFRKDDPDVNIVSSTPTMELGVDIGSLDTVAQVGVPPTLTNYVQRSGRTGRTRGSSSLVMTVVRGQHPVDGHYYANLDRYLGGFEPVRVPDPYDFDELLAGHLVTEVFAYLARNPHEEKVFERTYRVNEAEQENLTKFVNSVRQKLDILSQFIEEEMMDDLSNHIEGVFGPRGVEVLEEVFTGSGTLSLSTRTEQTFGRLLGMSSGAAANRSLTQNTSRLDQWLDQLGYLANYRSFGQSFPVKFSGRTDEISFESSGRLYDMYPGEENGNGAAITLHGTDYIVTDVRGTPASLVEVAICANPDCDRRFQTYEVDEADCPACEEPLAVTEVHEVGNVECSLARGGQTGWRTYAQLSTHVRQSDGTVREQTERSLFGLPCQVKYGQFEITDFVYAFERGHSASPDTTLLRAEALIETDESDGATGGSWRDQLDESEEESYRPVGQQYHTQGLVVRFDQADLAERFEAVEDDTAMWSQALTSLEQALQRAIAIVAECDRSDFRVRTVTTDETVELYVVDSRQGGNGITWRVHEGLDDVESRVHEIADCDRCADYCDECLLISRTPAHYLENDLLNHRTLEAVIEAHT